MRRMACKVGGDQHSTWTSIAAGTKSAPDLAPFLPPERSSALLMGDRCRLIGTSACHLQAANPHRVI
eukprot:349632-Chlamydomonas_euryale.AAC.38